MFFRLSPNLAKSLKYLAAAGLLLAVAWFIDIGDAIAILRQTNYLWLIPAVLIIQLQIVLSAWRWRITAARLGQELPFRRAVSEYYLATVANLSLPGGVTGDAARVYRNRQTRTLSTAVHSVMLERLAGQLALFVVSVIGWMLWPLLMQTSVPVFGYRLLAGTLGVVLVLALTLYLIGRFAPDRIKNVLTAFGPAMHTAWWAERQWLIQGVLSLSIVATYLLVFLFSSYAVQAPLPLTAAISIVPMVLLSMLIPLSIGGWGMREAAAAVLWPVAGLSSEAGVATSVVYALISLFACFPGLLLLYRSRAVSG